MRCVERLGQCLLQGDRLLKVRLELYTISSRDQKTYVEQTYRPIYLKVNFIWMGRQRRPLDR